MTLPVSGEQHDRAVEAGVTRYFVWRNQWSGDPEQEPYEGTEIEYVTEMFKAMLAVYSESLAEQGVVLVERPRCEACGGSGIGTIWNRAPCSRCNGTGRARIVDVNEVVNWLAEQHGTAAIPRFIRHLDTL